MNLMYRLFKLVAIFLGFAAVIGGCVSSGTYQQKELESQTLSKNLDESRSSYADLLQKYNKLSGDNSDLDTEIKKQKLELAESVTKDNQLAEKIKVLTADITVSKAENDKLAQENTVIADKLKKLAVNFVDARAEVDKLTLSNLSLTEKVRRFSDEIEQLNLANEKLTEAVKIENLLKTVSEHFEALQQKVNGLSEENAKLRQTLMEMRGMVKQTPVDTLSRGAELKAPEPAPVSNETLPEKVLKEKAPLLPADVKTNQSQLLVIEKQATAPEIQEKSSQKTDNSIAEDIPNAIITPLPLAEKDTKPPAQATNL